MMATLLGCSQAGAVEWAATAEMASGHEYPGRSGPKFRKKAEDRR
jgi:hypothetical protein